MARATFAARAQDGVEATFRQLAGVIGTRQGYLAPAAGQAAIAAVEVRFNPDVISYAELLEVYWRLNDPQLGPARLAETSPLRLSIVFYHDSDQRGLAIATKIRLERLGSWQGSLITEILPATPWLDGEAVLPPGSLSTRSSVEGHSGDE